MSDEPPKLRIAVENSEHEIRKQRAIDDLEWPTREMAANLLRVMRGAGRPHELPQQIINLSTAILEANELSNAWGIWSKIEEILQEAPPDCDDMRDEDYRPAVIRGSLQVCASRLVGQTTQINRGYDEISRGIRERLDLLVQRRIERIAAEEREQAKWAARMARIKQPAKKAAPKAKPKAAPRPIAKAQPKPSEPLTTAEAMRRRAEELRAQLPDSAR